jgi:hypothetical protein
MSDIWGRLTFVISQIGINYTKSRKEHPLKKCVNDAIKFKDFICGEPLLRVETNTSEHLGLTTPSQSITDFQKNQT